MKQKKEGIWKKANWMHRKFFPFYYKSAPWDFIHVHPMQRAVTVVTRNISVHFMRWPVTRALFHGNKHRMGPCGRVSEALLRPRLGRVRCPCRGDKLHTEGGVPGALGPCSLRSADGLVIIISRPLSYLTTSPRAYPTAASPASPQCSTDGHFSSCSLLCT